MKNYYHTIIGGSGPAGLAAAVAAANEGKSVLILERLATLSRKLLASGNTRCNFANTLPDDQFMASFGKYGRFMNDAVKLTPLHKLISFFESHGVKVEAKDSFHLFPSSGKAADVRNALLDDATAHGAETATGCGIISLIIEENTLRGIITESGNEILCDKLVLACGGTASPQLGGTDSGLKLAQKAGHTTVKTIPAMANIYIADQWIKQLSGVSLANAALTLKRKKNPITKKGELLFTHDGLSGPAAINLSAEVYRTFEENHQAALTISFDSSKNKDAWKSIFEEARTRDCKKFTRTVLANFFTHSLADATAINLNIYDKRCAEMTKNDIDALCEYLTDTEITVSAICPMEKAMAMAGGVSLKEINPKTLESRIVKGLFFAGEILDLTGPCGGYNIRFALTSGFLAGKSADI